MTQDESTTDYKITIRECNSIGEASISLRRGSLNIKYGPNGIGKSTIARALTLRTEGDGNLDDLTPFKHRLLKDGPRPSVDGAEEIKSVLTFNDAYVSQFVFQPDEVLKNSFEIFINTQEYRDGIAQIESMFESLKATFAEEPEFDAALTSFAELKDAFNVTKTGALAKNSKAFKGLGVGGKLAHIPEHLQGYEGFLKSDDPASWITWQTKGKEYLELSENCPFCSTANVDKATANKVSEEYDSASVRSLSSLRGVIDRLGQYLAPADLQTLTDLTTSISGLSTEQESFVVTLRTQVVALLTKLSDVKNLSFHALKDESNRAAILEGLKIDLKYLAAVNSEATQSVVALINGKLDAAITQINTIDEHIGKQNTRVKKLISSNQKAINDFLASAGYKYAVRIDPAGDTYRMLLDHQDSPGNHLDKASAHLSYGEKNAFALVLFMHHVLRESPDLVVLDDPVSSFDKTKKFAILHQLFHGQNSLRYTTSLLLTHDIEPAIDIVLTSARFKESNPVVHFLSGRSSKVSEKEISGADIKSFSAVCDDNIDSAKDPIIQSIYLRRRYEVHGALGLEYELLSSLLHARETPTIKVAGEHTPLTTQQIAEATAEVQKRIPSFDYNQLLAEMRTPGALKSRFDSTGVGYEKVQLFRVMSKVDPVKLKGNEIFTKFVNESFHIENEYVMQLNPREFDAVPEYVIAECTKLVEAAGV